MPSAVGGLESTLTSGCLEDANADAIDLSADGSFDVYVPDPANLASYEWYEDFGLATEWRWT